MYRQLLLYALLFICGLILLFTIELLIIKLNGKEVPAPKIARTPTTIGTGQKLQYVVMGDSTSIGQGTEYSNSYATASSRHLAEKYSVTTTNLGISGATAKSVLNEQLPKAVNLRPDLVLLGVGANDVTHFTSINSMVASLEEIIAQLKKSNPSVTIVLTRSPAMDAVSRFPFISKMVLRQRTLQVNKAIDLVIGKYNLAPAYIAEKTRAAFLADSTLTAEDNFHPNARGYALWTPIINAAIDTALAAKR